MNVVITGGAGFLGLRLARALLAQGIRDARGGSTPVDRLVLADRAAAPDLGDPRAEQRIGDIADTGFLAALVADADIVYHLAAVVSGEAEADFDLGMRVNIDASRALLEACRATERAPRVIFTSSVAVFGPVADDSEPEVDPRSSYGMEKAVAELLLKDYARRGFVDGMVLRLPTISVRPGRPNKAASSFASGVVREPLSGKRGVCPVPLDTVLWLLSPRQAISGLVHAAGLSAEQLAAGRIINLPGITVTVAEMLAALERQGGSAARALVDMEPDPMVAQIVTNWPRRWNDGPARALGFSGDSDFDAIVRAYVEDDLPGA
ncbi:SDR family oxidoreductase [soil metagenome]